MFFKKDEDLRARVAVTFKTLGDYLVEHAGDYADAVTCAPCTGYTVSFTDAMDGDSVPTVRLEVEHLDKRFFDI